MQNKAFVNTPPEPNRINSNQISFRGRSKLTTLQCLNRWWNRWIQCPRSHIVSHNLSPIIICGKLNCFVGTGWMLNFTLQWDQLNTFVYQIRTPVIGLLLEYYSLNVRCTIDEEQYKITMRLQVFYLLQLQYAITQWTGIRIPFNLDF